MEVPRNEKGQFVKGGRSLHWRHGGMGTPLYKKFKGIKRRCNNTHEQSYPLYGGRGIQCLWETFEQFKEDMEPSYLKHLEEFGAKETTIDRIDYNGHYCKKNCRWSTRKEQSRNRRSNIWITFNGETKSLIEWCEIMNLPYKLIRERIGVHGYSFEEAIQKPKYKHL